MWALRPFLRRGGSRVATRQPHLRRLQHGYTPHKEYFQNRPGQSPLPDQPITYQSATPGHSQTPQLAHFPTPQPSRFQSLLRRSFRSAFWATLFGALGAAAGAGLITWEYVNSPIPLDEEEEEEFLQDILEDLRTHPLVESLIEQQWQIQEVYPKRSMPEMEAGLELLYEKLMGTGGITIHEFTHPTLPYTMLVFYLTDGLEGWPDTVHGGIITSMLSLAAKRHLRRFYLQQEWTLDEDTILLNVDFKAPVHPEDIFAILVPPASVEQGVFTDDGQPTLLARVQPALLQILEAPEIEINHDVSTQSETHAVMIPADASRAPVNATSSVCCRLLPRDPVSKESESA